MTPDLHALAEEAPKGVCPDCHLRSWRSAIVENGSAHLCNNSWHRWERYADSLERALAVAQAAHEAERAAAVVEALERAAQECERYGSIYFARRVRALKPSSDLVCVPRHVLEELSLAIHDMEGSGMEITELLDHAWGQLTVVLDAAKS